MKNSPITATVTIRGPRLARVAANFDRATAAGVRNFGHAANREVARGIQGIYSEAVPSKEQVRAYNAGRRMRRSPRSGGLAWKRTGALRRGRVLITDATSATVTVTGRAGAGIKNWPGGYAQRREALGATGRPSWTPRRPALGRVRRREFMREPARRLKPRVGRLFMQGFESELFK